MENNIRKDNRKALPKYILTLVISMVVGAVCGFFAIFFSGRMNKEQLLAALEGIMTAVSPWAILAAAVVLLIPCAFLLRAARTRLQAWDQEDEEAADRIDRQLNIVLILSNLLLILEFFLFSMCFVYQTAGYLLLGVLFFIAALGGSAICQQKAVDLTRTMNPEKKGSIYDSKFQKKWLESCDEAERKQIGEAAMKAFQISTAAATTLWVLLFFSHLFFGTGLLPMAVVLILWGIQVISFQAAASKSGRRS